MKTFRLLGIVLAAVVLAAGCGGGGGASLAPPAYNVTGTWNVTMTIGYNTAGVSNGTQESAVLIMNQQTNSNTVYVRDQNAAVGDAQPATLSGNSFSYAGPSSDMYGCTDMVANLTGTFDTATRLTGKGRLTCRTSGDYGDVTFSATKQ